MPSTQAQFHIICFVIIFTCSLMTFATSQPSQHLDIEKKLTELETLMVKRLHLMKEVAAHKWLEEEQIYNAQREEQLLEFIGVSSQKYGLKSEAIKEIFKIQFAMSRDIQFFWFHQWRQNPAGFTLKPRSLARILRPQINKLTEEIIGAIYFLQPYLKKDSPYLKFPMLSNLANYPISSTRVFQLQKALTKMERLPPHITPIFDRVVTSNIIRIGTPGDYIPFSHLQNNRYDGVDIDIAQRIASDLRVKVVFVPTSWPNLMKDFNNNLFDLAIGGISITEERLDHAYFSNPYHEGGKAIIGQCSLGEKTLTLDDLDSPDITLIVNPGGTNEKFIKAQNLNAKLIVHDNNQEIFQKLNRLEADAMITDLIEVQIKSKQYSNLCQLSKGTLNNTYKGVLAKQDTRLVAEINNTLERMKRSGELDDLFENNINNFAK